MKEAKLQRLAKKCGNKTMNNWMFVEIVLVIMSNHEPRNVLSYELFLLICIHTGS